MSHIVWDLSCPVYVCMLVTQSCPTLCNPTDYNLPGSSVHEDSPGKNMEWVAMPSGIKPMPPAVEAWGLNHWTTRDHPALPFLFFPLFGYTSS